MLKQGLAQERVGDVSMSQLPPQGTLPQWSRINTLDKARYPKSFLKDKLQPLEPRQTMEGEDKELEVSGMVPAQRIQYLERSLLFLRQQHSDVLRALHSEVEELKRENKDLQHKAVMIQRSQQEQQSQRSPLSLGDLSSGTTARSKHGTGRSREEGSEEVKVMFLEEEIKELKHALRETRNKNTYLQQRLEQSEEACKRQQTTLDSLKQQAIQGGGGGGGGALGLSSPGQDGSPPVMTHHVPHGAAGAGAAGVGGQPQSLGEYQVVIRQLQQLNERQAHELESLKSDLRDVLYSHKWTPDAYLLAKAYVMEDDKKGHSAKGSKSALPKISIKERGQPILLKGTNVNDRRKVPRSEIVPAQDSSSLPALPKSVGNRAIERRKRTQIMQKAKLRKQIVPE